MKTFNTLAEFKRLLQPGDKLHTVNHTNVIGRDSNNKVVYGDYVYPVRECSIKQSNSFAFKTEKEGKIVDSWCDFPKASMCKVEDNKLIILQRDARNFSGGAMDESNQEYKNLPLIPVLTYWFAD